MQKYINNLNLKIPKVILTENLLGKGESERGDETEIVSRELSISIK